MNRTAAALAATLALALPAAAGAHLLSAAPTAVKPVAKPLGPVVAKLKTRTDVPVYAPSYLPIPRVKGHPLVASGSGRTGTWDIELAYDPRCHQATACFAGSLTAERTTDVVSRFDGHRVALHHGITGRFRGLSCGASCSPPQIAWKLDGVIYRFQVNVNSRRHVSDAAKFVRIANSAIDAGPR